MRSGGIWPNSDKYELNLYVLYTMSLLSFLSLGDIIFQSAKILFLENVEELTGIIFVLLTKFGTLFKVIYFIKNIKIVKELIRAMDDNYLFKPENLHQIIIIKPILKIWKLTLIILWILTMTAISFWTFFPIIDKTYRNYRLPFSCWYPYNTNQAPFYQITYVYQIASIVYVAVTTNSADFLISTLYAFLSSQLDILCDNMKKLGFGSKSDTKQELIKCIEHHRDIIR